MSVTRLKIRITSDVIRGFLLTVTESRCRTQSPPLNDADDVRPPFAVVGTRCHVTVFVGQKSQDSNLHLFSRVSFLLDFLLS
ncbi:hypothetical protein AAC387_Pa08g0806 [Persea americana]